MNHNILMGKNKTVWSEYTSDVKEDDFNEDKHGNKMDNKQGGF